MLSSGRAYQSRTSGLAITSIISAISSTVRAMGPVCLSVPNGFVGHTGILPNVGLRPTQPQKLAGIRVEPPPSVPSARVVIPSTTATALPPLDPPEVRLSFHGLRVIPVSGLSVTPFQPSSQVVVLPNRTAPLRRNRSTLGSSSRQSWFGLMANEPRNVGQPRVKMRSLIAIGIPSTLPNGSPRI